MKTLKVLAFLFGIAFIFAGICGFIPSLSPNGYLFSIFEVDTMHNIVHLVSGIIALIAASKASYAKSYFIIFGFIYAIVTILGFAHGGDILGIMHVNMADNFLHLVIAIIALFLGFTFKAKA